MGDIYNFVSFIGGKYIIEDIEKFNEMYSNAFNEGMYLYLVERVIYPSKFYIDIDKTEMSENIIDIICEKFKENEMIICKCTESNGIHVIFQDLKITSPEEGKNILKSKGLSFDESVYHTGLRMIGSRKPNMDRIYLPKYIYKNNMMKKLKSNNINKDTVKKCSINIGITNISYPSNKVRINTVEKNNKNNSILRIVNDKYSDSKITKVKQERDKIYITTNSRFCLNKNGEHENTKVYFVIEYGEIYQKCFCKCRIERMNGFCSYFKSKPKSIPIQQLYDFKQENNLISVNV